MKSRGFISKLTDNRRTDSLTSRFRQKRWEYFRELTNAVGRPMKILDVGGTQTVWERIGFADQPDVHIVLLNLNKMPANHWNMESLAGDGRSMPQFKDKEFDIVFSNSVIEHVGGIEGARSMAEEVRRVGKNYYIQTPYRYFPIEPHFFFPMWQFLPVSLRTTLVQNFQLGWEQKRPDRKNAEEQVRSIYLLTRKEMKKLFPEATTLQEHLLGLPKSIQCYRFATASAVTAAAQDPIPSKIELAS